MIKEFILKLSFFPMVFFGYDFGVEKELSMFYFRWLLLCFFSVKNLKVLLVIRDIFNTHTF